MLGTYHGEGLWERGWTDSRVKTGCEECLCVYTCKYTQVWMSVNLCNTHGNLSFAFEHSNCHWSDGKTCCYGHFLYCIHTNFLCEFPHLWIFIGHLLYWSSKILHVYLRHPNLTSTQESENEWEQLAVVQLIPSAIPFNGHLPWSEPPKGPQKCYSLYNAQDRHVVHYVLFPPLGWGRAEEALKPSILLGTYYYSLCISY